MAELFQILKDDVVKGLHSICQQIWKLSSGHKTRKGQFSFQSQSRTRPKKCSNYHTIALISHASKVMLKILQARLQQYVNWELPDVQAGFRKGRGTREQITNIRWIIKKSKRVSDKHLLLLYWLCQSFVWITTNCGKFWKRWEIPDHLTCLLKICMQVRKQQLELDMEQ